MVTEQEFIEATRIVKEYFEQITKSDIDKSKTLINEFCNKIPPYESISGKSTSRLKSALYRFNEMRPEVKYIEDIKQHELLRVLGVGVKAWHILENLKMNYTKNG